MVQGATCASALPWLRNCYTRDQYLSCAAKLLQAKSDTATYPSRGPLSFTVLNGGCASMIMPFHEPVKTIVYLAALLPRRTLPFAPDQERIQWSSNHVKSLSLKLHSVARGQRATDCHLHNEAWRACDLVQYTPPLQIPTVHLLAASISHR